VTDVVPFPRYGIPGYYALADLPQRAPLKDSVLSTGWSELDLIFRLYPEQFTVITGKPGHGKSTFVFNLLINVSRLHSIRSFVYGPENEDDLDDKLQRIWLAGDRSDGAQGRFEYFRGSQIFLQSNRLAPREDTKTIGWVLGRAAIAVEKDRCELVVIDPWNWIERIRQRDQPLTEYINDCLYDVKDFAQHFGVMVIMIGHPTKAVNEHGGRTPTLYDIEGSANWANKCDNGLVITRDSDTGITKIISMKVRQEPYAGRPGSKNFWVDGDSGLFVPYVGAASEYEPPAKKY